tara:strand:+ start:9333 stop:9785 length:453 start_codon:yes stop_codon:yes gene_type:complete
MSINQFTRYGFAAADDRSISGSSFTTHELTVDSDIQFSSKVPSSAFLGSIEFQLTGISDGDELTIFLCRDSTGNVPLTSQHLEGATQRVTTGIGSATSGGCSFTINKDFHFDDIVTGATQGSLYVAAKCLSSAGSAAPCTATAIRLNWRG